MLEGLRVTSSGAQEFPSLKLLIVLRRAYKMGDGSQAYCTLGSALYAFPPAFCLVIFSGASLRAQMLKGGVVLLAAHCHKV